MHLLEFPFFSIAKFSQILWILSSVGFGRIQNHFFSAKISQIVQVCLGMVLDASKTIFHA